MAENDLTRALANVIARLPSGGEIREGQVDMAVAVEHAIEQRRHLIVQAGTGTGKALDVDTLIPTPHGFVRMGDLKAGDVVFGDDGKPVRVAHAFELQYGRDCFEVVFSDKTKIVADADHLWLTSTRSARVSARRGQVYDAKRVGGLDQRFKRVLPQVRTTREIASTLRVQASANAGVYVNHSIRNTLPLETPEADLAIDPYLLGVWLGDGTTGTAHLTVFDNEIVDRVRGRGYLVTRLQAPGLHSVQIPGVDIPCRWTPGFVGLLDQVGVRRDKHIPAQYLFASERQRRALLAGLLDTDGTVSRTGAIQLCLTNKRLIEDAASLVASLGFRASVWEARAKLRGKDCGPKWTLQWTTDESVFLLERKALEHKRRLSNFTPCRNNLRYIVAVNPVESRPVRCISVDNESHLYLAGQSFIPTHNSLGYLVPAILSGGKVVVSTATKALQDQLVGKDLPFLQQALPMPFEFAMLKGRSNYLCMQRAKEVQGGGDEQLQLDAVETTTSMGKEIVKLVEWGRTTQTGDRSDLPFEPSPRAWQMVSVTGMECPGATKCPSGGVCFAERARLAAEDADVIVVNTHLYGSHLSSGGHVLPDHDVVVFDEAHELEDIAASALGLEMTSGRFSSLARNARRLVGPGEAATVDELIAAGDKLERALEPFVNQRLVGELPSELTEVLTTGIERTQALLRAIKGAPDDDPSKARVQMAGGHLAGDLGMIRDVAESHVRWVEGPAHAPVLKVAPIDVGGALAEQLWPERTAILTSATVPAGLAGRVGIGADEHDELDAGSPFDFSSQALLYCATHLPDPRNPKYRDALHDELAFLIEAAGGRTLALFTSYNAMNQAAEAMRARLDVPILAQGDLPKPKLVAQFAGDEAACLFATMGYWQGVDVPGRTLSLVTIDKLPFPRPDEPLLVARRERAGAAAFRLIDLPRAATMLAQGAGRLIRTADDHGVVAVMDSRLATANYRWDLINALPPMKRTKERAEVAAFLRAYHANSTSPPERQ